MNTVPTAHPPWCDEQHADDFPGHIRDVGSVDLGEIDLLVSVYQYRKDPPQVWLSEQRHDATSVTVVSAVQAELIGWSLIQAAGIATGHAPVDGPSTHQNRVDLLTGRLTRMLGDWHR